MNDSHFATLLTLYMRRIRASAAGVAAEIGLSREAVNNWRNGVSLPNPRSRDRLLACARYLRLTETETNHLCVAAGFAPEYPLFAAAVAETPFASFIDGVFEQLDRLSPYPVAMLLSQAHWGQPPFRAEILLRAAAIYGEQAVLHVQPPYSVSTASADYFAALGRQCGFEGVGSDYEFEAALERRLIGGERLFCMVSRFEQGTPALRETLAGILRSLSEMHGRRLHLLLCGGETLADLKYRAGDLSLLNIAQVDYWPELTRDDLAALAHRRWPGRPFDDALLDCLMRCCGGHPALIEEGLAWLAEHGPGFDAQMEAALHAHLARSARLWQAFVPVVADDAARARLSELLRAPDLGRARPYLQDADLRRLFWSNLVCVRGQGDDARLHWRCAVVRDAGLQVLESCAEA